MAENYFNLLIPQWLFYALPREQSSIEWGNKILFDLMFEQLTQNQFL